MKYLLDHKEMKAVDMYSINTVGIPSLVLMERAALKVAEHLLGVITKKDKILAVSGSGNNGADAVAAARILFNMGYQTEVYLAVPSDRISDELKVQLNVAKNLNIPVYIREKPDLSDYDWLIDGVFGIGLSRNVEGFYAEVIDDMNRADAKICAVDIPSGIFADNGQILGCAVKADMTVTFGFDKIGMVLYPGALYAGELFVEDIGFAKDAGAQVKPKVTAMTGDDLKKVLPKRMPWSNKGTYGRLLVIAGKKNMCGASCLCAKAAYKMGTGLVKIAAPEQNRQIIQTLLPEAVLETYDSETLSRQWILKQLTWADAVVIGPGLGTGPETELFLQCVLEQTKPAVIDADGLNVLAKHTDWLKWRQCPVIVTPHLGEMSRLIQTPVEDISRHLIEVCEDFAKRYDVICVLKDARSVISDGKGHTCINLSGNNGMSTGGSGDVLAGIIGGLICGHEDLPLWFMAAGGAYIHGLCGDEAKKVQGVYGLLASDIIQYMSSVVK